MQKRVLFNQQGDSSQLKVHQCIMCPEQHRLLTCDSFNKLSVPERQYVFFKNKLCYKCLYPGHQVRQCRGGYCAKCGKKHNTKLHNEIKVKPTSTNDQVPSAPGSSVVTYVEQADNDPATRKQVMLATAVVCLINADGHQVYCRAILDSGSQVCLITKECA